MYATRGRALHQLMPHGVTRQLAGNDEPLASAAAANSAAAAASANDSASDDPDSAVAMSSGGAGGGGGRSAGRGVPQEEELRYGMGAGGGMDAGVNPCLMWPGACSFMPFTNIQVRCLGEAGVAGARLKTIGTGYRGGGGWVCMGGQTGACTSPVTWPCRRVC